MNQTKELLSSTEIIALESEYGAHNYHPLPVVLSKGKGIFLWDVENKKYYDFLSAYSAVNQGHCHPKLIKAMTEQIQQLTLTSRAFYNDKLGRFEKFMAKEFNFDKVLAMNSGAEAVETAIKITRKWGYEKKGIPSNKAKIIIFDGNFHGRTTTIISFSTDPVAKTNFGPYTEGFLCCPYNKVEKLAELIKDSAVAGVLIEPIQGEAGVNVPDKGFLTEVKKLCTANNVLFVADEIQTGIGRTGKMLCCDYENITPDILILGKALSGGMYPVSAILANNDVMSVLKPGEHGSTYGGNPLAATISIEAIKVLKDENLIENANMLGELFRTTINSGLKDCKLFKLIRGKGLLNAVIVNDSTDSTTAWDICVQLKENGLLAKPTHGNIIRFAPPLVITEDEILDCCAIIIKTFLTF